MSYPERILPHCEHIQHLRRDLIAKLGAITVAEKMLPEVFEQSPYENTLDELREATERAITEGRAVYQGIEVVVEIKE